MQLIERKFDGSKYGFLINLLLGNKRLKERILNMERGAKAADVL